MHDDILRGDPDQWRTSKGSIFRFAGRHWLRTSEGSWGLALRSPKRNYVLDLSEIDFVTLPALAALTAFLEKLLAKPETLRVEVDLKGPRGRFVHNRRSFDVARKRAAIDPVYGRSSEFQTASRMFGLVGFIEAMGLHSVLNVAHRSGRLVYLWFTDPIEELRGYYTRSESETVVNPLMRIATKESCTQFLANDQIKNWKDAMGRRFDQSPLFEFEALWRILCHEMAVNIYEHAESPGFIATRVVVPNKMKRGWGWIVSYPTAFQPLLKRLGDGFVELCVSDAGRGFINTLENSFRRQAGVRTGKVNPADVLAFAFDEAGTSKRVDDSWVTERHALGRILMLVSRYGGMLALRSGGKEVIYLTHGGQIQRRPNHLGYEPSHAWDASKTSGSDLHVILPLKPLDPQTSDDWRSRIFTRTLPQGFVPNPGHPQGHLEPLLESLGLPTAAVETKERSVFRTRCSSLVKRLLKRPPGEALILDFSGLDWATAQFETFLHFIESVLQNRPVLLVEIEPTLARAIADEVGKKPTQLKDDSAPQARSTTGVVYGEISENRYLDTLRSANTTILGVDNGSPQQHYLFGVGDKACEERLLSLLVKPKQTADQLVADLEPVQKVRMRAILDHGNPLFVREGARWSLVWTPAALEVQTRRAMSKHFDVVAASCEAWHPLGVPHAQWKKEKGEKAKFRKTAYHLPWQKEWVTEFFESSRILSRQRYSDDAAQRLIYRIGLRLTLEQKGFEDVSVLACATAPAILLATALHRWWPTERRPAIADLGPYLMLNPDGPLPAIAGDGRIMIVQDILDRHVISGRLCDLLRKQGKIVVGVAALARLVDSKEKVGVTPPALWTLEKIGKSETSTHAFVNLLRPDRVDPTTVSPDNIYWVEPRTLRPFLYKTLRRQLRQKVGIQRERVRPLFKARQEGLICAGHYVYGERHYAIALDVKAAIDGEIGDEISAFLADVCAGVTPRHVAWESLRGSTLAGEVTAVLMPLHSQIHYLWPKVENLLAQRDRRQPVWLLDATLFLGHGPSYRLPLQLSEQIWQRAQALAAGTVTGGLRILILDDATVTSQTIETILAALNREAEKACENEGGKPLPVRPIQWIRYFAIFNQMSETKHQHWRSLEVVGARASAGISSDANRQFDGIPFAFDQYCSVTGVPVYEEKNCPFCADLKRLETLIAAAERLNVEPARAWATSHRDSMHAVATDGPGFRKRQPLKLPRAIDLLGRAATPATPDEYCAGDADEAILRFYELMYTSMPPTDALRSLSGSNAVAAAEDTTAVRIEYERFRWAVLEWCIRNWPRLAADCAQEAFLSTASAELEFESGLVVPLFESLAQRRHDPPVASFVIQSLENLVALEHLPGPEEDAVRRQIGAEKLLLEQALLVYLLSVPPEERFAAAGGDAEIPEAARVFKRLAELAAATTTAEMSLVRNLYLVFLRPRRMPNPAWPLQVVAEALFRGRDSSHVRNHVHLLLPRLVKLAFDRAAQPDQLRLLQSSLGLFVAALQDLEPFCVDSALPTRLLLDQCNAVLTALRGFDPLNPPSRKVFGALHASLRLTAEFCVRFEDFFHATVAEYAARLKAEADALASRSKKLHLDVRVPPELGHRRVLAPVQRLVHFINNWTMDYAKNHPGEYSVRIVISLERQDIGAPLVRFRLLTGFTSLEETNEYTLHGAKYSLETNGLTVFGIILSKQWFPPSDEEMDDDFTSAFHIDCPTGL